MLVKNIHGGTHVVDLMVSSSDRGFTSVIDILIHTGRNTLHTSNSDSSLDSSSTSKQVNDTALSTFLLIQTFISNRSKRKYTSF